MNATDDRKYAITSHPWLCALMLNSPAIVGTAKFIIVVVSGAMNAPMQQAMSTIRFSREEKSALSAFMYIAQRN
jgi:hypothetical protein